MSAPTTARLKAFKPPKSLLRLLLAGFLVVTTPLVLALAIAAWSVERLASESQLAIYDAVGVTENSAHMARVAMDIERAARRYVTHNDPAAMQDYRRWRRELASAGAPPGAFGPDEANWLHQGLRVVESTLLVSLNLLGTEGVRGGERIPDLSLALHRSVAAISAAGYRRIDEEVEQVQAFSEQARELVVYHLAAAVPITLAFTLFFARRIHRPIRELGEGIRRLGTAGFEQPVTIHGPQDLQHLGDELDHLRRHLAALQNQRQRFLRHVSHELKTPLSAVLEGAELLQDPQLAANEQRRAEIAGIVRENGHELRRQIENLLRFARHGEALAESGAREKVNLPAIIEEVAERHHLPARRRNIRIETECDRPLFIQGERNQLATVIDNLLSNALRFSPDGGTIRIKLRQDRGLAELRVLDEGEGIPDDQREQVFEPFQQGTAQSRGSVKGSGLGLSLVRECVAEHAGTVTAESRTDGPGTCMRVRLPAPATTETPHE